MSYLLKIDCMEKDLENKLKTEVDKASWDMLLDHHERGAVFLVASGVDLVKVGAAIASDNSELVGLWLQNSELKKVTPEMSLDFEKDLKSKLFDFLIVQPYVLIKLKKN